jgi:fibronectin type 3 domain-containing protein
LRAWAFGLYHTAALSAALEVTTATAGWKYDFGPASQVVAEGFNEVNRGTAYSSARGYGFVTNMSGALDRDRGNADDPVGRDFVAWFGNAYEFAVDVPNGIYTARVTVGDYIGSARTNVVFEGRDFGSVNAGNSSVAIHDKEGIFVEDGQLNMIVSGQTGHLNGLELTRIGDIPGQEVEPFDASFDFGPASQVVADGFDEVNRGTAYSSARGYGFTTDMSTAIDRDRGGDDPLGRDFVAWFGGEYEFAVDVPNGIYNALVTTGDLVGSTRTNVAFEGVAFGSANSGSQTVTTHDFQRIVVEDGQLNMTVTGQTGHLNGLEISRVGNLPGQGTPPAEPCDGCVRQVESIDRSPVAVDVDGGVYLGWRKLGNDPADVSFNVYRDGRLIAQTAGTSLTDADGGAGSAYYVAVVEDGAEVEYTELFTPWTEQYVDIDMNRPADGTNQSGDYFYRPNDATVADLTGDGKYEIIQKWEPSNAQDNSRGGFTGNVYIDAYTLDGEQLWRIDLGRNIRAGAHYTSLIAYDFDGDGRAELALKTGDGTVDGVGNVIGDADADHRNASGYILTGPEYFTVFDGLTGAALDTVDFRPERGNMCDWGDCYGNRGDRLMAAVAYLDGEGASIVTSRGIYTKSVITAWDWDGESLEQRWEFNSVMWGPQYGGQGNHQLSIADVNGNGYDDIVYGALTLGHDGRPLYSSELGHGDALHVSDFTNDGKLEIFSPFECMSCSGNIGAAMRDAETGDIIWSMPGTRDIGRAACGDIDPRHPGVECWANTRTGEWDSKDGQLRAADGTLIQTGIPSANHMIWWDGDLGREILDHEFNEADYVPIYPYIAEWDYENGVQNEIFTPEDVHSNNGTKGNPVLTADLFGDWREEVVWRKADNTGVRIFTTVIETEYSMPTLMHDPQYRMAIAWQNESYNQPPWPSFYIGYDADPADVEWAAIDYDRVGATEPPLVAGDCSVEYKVASNWGDGFVVQIKVTNTGDTAIDVWDLRFASSAESVKHSWGGEIAVAGGVVTVDPAFWNFPLKPGKTKQVGFQGTGDPDDPGVFLMNGKVCAAA